MSIYREMSDLVEKGERAAFCTIVQTSGSTPRHAGSKMVVYEDGRISGTVGGGEVEARVIQEALNSLNDGKTRLLRYEMVNPKEGDPGICGGTLSIYVEPHIGKPILLIIGGGHVGRAVAHLGKWLGFQIVISDDRPEYCTPESNPDADQFLVMPMEKIPTAMKVTPQTYVVLTTRGVAIDVAGIPEFLNTPAPYLGIIGSKRRWLTTRKKLVEAGLTEEQLKRIISPIGLELRAETPEEIAVSILAEILMLRNGASGQKMTM